MVPTGFTVESRVEGVAAVTEIRGAQAVACSTIEARYVQAWIRGC